MTTTTPRQGPPRGHQNARPRGHNCARHSHVPQRTGRPVRRDQSSGLSRRAHHGEMRPGRHGLALKTQTAHPSLTPIPTRTGHQYRTTWVKGVPMSHKSGIRTGRPNVAIECHQRTRRLWRRHGDVPRTSHGGLPTTCHDGLDCHHRRLQCSPISGRSRRTTDTRGRSGTSGHATSRPAGPHSLSTRPALTQTTTT